MLLSLLLFCSVFRVLAVCCFASSYAAAGDDSLRSCYKCFCACNLVDLNVSHRTPCHRGSAVLQRDAMVGIGVTAQTTAGNLKRHTPRRRAGARARTNNTRTGAYKQGPKQPATTGNTQCARERRKQKNTHGTQQPWVQPSKSMRVHPDTKVRSNRSTGPTATTEALGKPPAPETLPGH